MKKTLLLLTLLLAGSASLRAQDWKDALSKVATAAADKATGGKLTQLAVIGTWEYSGPGIKLESDDTLSELGGSALSSGLEKRLEPVYTAVGIKPGACRFTFGKEGDFQALLGNRTLEGTYEFDASTHVMTLHLNKAVGKLGTLNGHAYLSGTQMQLVFPSEKLLELVSGLGAKVSSLRSLTSALDKYKSIAIGFNFSK